VSDRSPAAAAVLFVEVVLKGFELFVGWVHKTTTSSRRRRRRRRKTRSSFSSGSYFGESEDRAQWRWKDCELLLLSYTQT
jgi:hypothetical protein